jgi:tetratricopeptide (TPR) repeat protein
MWSQEELDKIQKLLLSEDEDNQLLAMELLNQVENRDEFIPILSFLLIADSNRPEVEYAAEEILMNTDETLNSYWKKVCEVFDPYVDYTEKDQMAFDNLEKHIALFDSFLEQAPRFSKVYQKLGKELIKRLSKPEKGLEFIRKAADANPNDFQANFDYAFQLAEKKEHADTIIKHYMNCLNVNNSFFEIYHNLGKTYVLKRDIKKAVEVFRLCLAKFPQKWETMIELSLSLKELGDKDEARSLLEQALALNPESHLAHNNMSFLLWSEYGEHELALNHIKRALEILPKKGIYWHTEAEVHWYGFKNKEKALEALYQGKKADNNYKGGDSMIRELEK